MALNVHSNQQEQLLENSQRISNECKREYQNNKKITGSVPGGTLAAISLFCSLCPPLRIILRILFSPAPQCVSHLLFFSFFSPIYITLQDLNLFPKRRILLFPFFFSSLFLNLPIKSNLPNFKFPSKTFQGESRLP